MKTIVVGYDDTDSAKRALARAAELARVLDAKLVVTSVAGVLVGAAAARGVGGYDPADAPEAHGEQLAHARAFTQEHGLDAEFVVAAGDVATEILDVAESRDAELIVVGARERNLLARLLDPSVSGAVQRRAHRDVLVVH